MNRNNFGKIVASLREDLGLTQNYLADLAEIPHHVMSLIERGRKSYLAPDLLVALADALQLTTSERYQFFLASTGVDTIAMVRPNLAHTSSDTANPEKELERLQEAGGQLRMPAFVIDPFFDFVMVNRPMLALFKIEQPMIDYLASIPRGFNSIHLTFGKGLLSQAQVDWNWEQYAFSTMRGFRDSSLRYRDHPYLQYLLQAFRNPDEYPFFNRFWSMVASTQEDKETDWDYLEYKDKEHGHMKYMVDTTHSITAYGELHFIKYFAMNENTERVFDQLAVSHGTEMLRFASWPEKEYPGKQEHSKPRTR